MAEVEELAPEPELLGDEMLVDLFDELSVTQLADTLQDLGLQKSGSKDVKIARLTGSRFNSTNGDRTSR